MEHAIVGHKQVGSSKLCGLRRRRLYAVFSAITLAVTYIIVGVPEPQAGRTPADLSFHRRCVHGKTL